MAADMSELLLKEESLRDEKDVLSVKVCTNGLFTRIIYSRGSGSHPSDERTQILQESYKMIQDLQDSYKNLARYQSQHKNKSSYLCFIKKSYRTEINGKITK